MSRQFSLLIATKPVWATDPVLVDALVDTVYSVQLVASDTLTFAVRTGELCPGVSMDATGLMTGSPTAEGTYVFTVRAEGDSPTVFTDRTFKQVVAAFPTWITASALPDMVAGSAGQVQLVAQSTTFFTVSAGFLPLGVTMTPQGLLSGTPASSGTYGFTVTATSASPLFETDKTFSVIVKTSPAWVTAPVLADSVTGTAVSVQLEATEGATYTIVAGQLRGGLAMSPTGLVSGTPSLPGSFGFTVRASNATGYGVDRAFTLLVVSTPTWATPATLPDLVADQPVSLQFQAAGATSYQVTGTLPTGVTFTSQGVLSGTPTAAGTFGFDVEASTASASVSSTRTFAVLVSKRPVFTTDADIASAVRGGAVSGTIAAQDATTYSVTAGAIPTGATLGASGALTGTYNAAGTFSFDVKAAGTSAEVTAKQTFTQTIVETPLWTTSETLLSLRYDAVSLQLEASYAVQYTAQTALPAGLTLSSSGLLEGAATAVGAFPFTVRAVSSVPAVFSDRVFTITVAAVPTWVTPAGALDSSGVGVAVSFALEATTAGSYVVKSGTLPQGLTLASTGLLSGTPTTAETQTFTVRASSGSVYADRTFEATVSSLPVWTTGSALEDIAKDAAYSFTLVASNTASYTLQSGSLPAGVTLASATGVLSGTPTFAGSYSFTIRATRTGAASVFMDRAFTLLIATMPTWNTGASLANTAQSVAYSLALAASDADATGFAVTVGALPPGVSLAANGTLSGTPTAAAAYSFTVKATSTTSATIFATRAFTLITVPLPEWTTTSLVDVASNIVYSVQLTATNAVTFAVKTGTLPTGLSLSSGGLLTGTPSATGSFSFTITATGNATNALTDQALVQLVATTPTWSTAASLENTSMDVAYSFTLAATNASATGFSVTTGSLPAGVSMSTAGVLSGTPTALATYSFTVRALSTTSSQIFADRAFTLTTVPLPVWTTNSLVDVASGVVYSVQLAASNATSYALKTGTLPTGLSLSSGGLLSGTPSAAGTFSFTITATGDAINAVTDQALTQIVAVTPTWTTAASLENTAQSVAYSFALLASNASATGYSLLSGALPAGVTLGTDGTLSGTPTAVTTYNFTVRVLSVLSATIFADRAFSLTTVPLPVWSSPTAGALTDLPTGAAITTINFVATNGVSYTVTVGSLPTGLSLSSGGALTGTPTAAGSFSFTVRATGGATNATADRAFTQIVAATPVWTTSASLADLATSTAVSFQFVATDAVSYALTSGTLPTGLSLSSSGLLTGTTNNAVTYNYTIRATGTSAVAFADRAFTQNVQVALAYVPYRGLRVGENVSFVLASDGTVYGCAGGDGRRTGAAETQSVLTAVPNLSGIVRLGEGGHAQGVNFAQNSSGQWYVWGNRNAGALGDGTANTGAIAPTAWSYVPNVIRMVTVSGTNTFALTSGGTWYYWGQNGSGELGTGNTTAVLSPTALTALSNVKDIAAQTYGGFMYLLEDGSVYASGPIDGTRANLTTPTLIIGGVTRMYAGVIASFVQKSDGTWWCWGANGSQALGLGHANVVSSTSPVRNTYLEGIGSIRHITSGSGNTIVVLSSGTVISMGNRANSGSETGSTTATLADLPSVFHSATGWSANTFWLTTSGALWSGGNNANKQCGDAAASPRPRSALSISFTPAPLAITPTWCTPSAISATTVFSKRLLAQDASTFALQSGSLPAGLTLSPDGLLSGTVAVGTSAAFTIRATGYNVASFADRTFTVTASESGIKKVVCCSSAWTMILMTDGTVYAQGYSADGLMGNGSGVTSYAVPTKIASLTNIVDVASAGNMRSFAALDASGAVWCWGMNIANDIRTGTNTAAGTNVYIPIANTFLPTITKLWSGGANIGNVWALTATGAVWTWGRTDYNAGNTNGTAIPILIPGLTDIVKVSQGNAVVALSSTGVTYSFNHITSVTAGSLDQSFLGTGITGAGNVARQLSTEVADVLSYNVGIVQLMKNGDVLYNGWQNVNNVTSTYWVFPTKNVAASGRNVVALYGGYGTSYYMRTAAGAMYYFDLGPDNDWLPVHAVGNFMPVTVPTPMVKSLNEGYIFRTLWTQGQDGRVYAFGAQTWTTTDTSGTRYNDPVSVPVMTTFAQKNTLNSFGKYRGVSMANNQPLGFYIRDNGLVYGFGANSDGKVTGATGSANTTLTQISNLANIVQVSSCDTYSYAMDNTGAWYVWGAYPAGGRGDGSTTSGLTTPVAFTTPYTIAKIVCAEKSCIAWTSNGDLIMWGVNSNGELGNGSTSMVASPIPFTALSNVKTVYSRTYGFGFLLNNGDLYITGALNSGNTTTPILVTSNVVDLWGAPASQFLRKTDGSIWVWGQNGRLTLGTGFASAVPHTSITRHTALEALGTVKHIVSNNQATIVLLTSGAVYACGDPPYYKGVNVAYVNNFELLSMPAITYIHHNGYTGTYLTSDLKVYVSGNTYTGFDTAGSFFDAVIRTPGFQIAPLGDKPYWSTPTDLSGPALDVAYSKQLLAVDGYNFAVLSGTLPTGLSLSTTGVLSGTPTAAGSYNWTVRALGGSTTTYADKAFSMDLTTTIAPDAEFEALKSASRLTVSGGTFNMAAFSMLPKTNVYDFVAVDVTTGTTAVTTFNFSLWTGTAYNTFSATPAALSGYTAATSTGSTTVTANTTYYTRFLVSMNLLTVQVYTAFTSATWTLTGQTMSKTYVIPADMGDAAMENASFSSTGLSNVFSINVPFLTARVYQRGIAKSGTTSFVIASNGDVYGAGYNTDGRLTGVVGTATNTFAKVPSLSGITHFNEGSEYASQLMYARDASGTWFQWGVGVAYERGDGTNSTGVLPPRAFPYLPGMSRVVKGANGNTFGLAGGKWYMWGVNGQGQIGNGTTAAIALPTEFTALTGIKDVGAATRGFVFLLNNGNLYGTGNFDDTGPDKLTPTLLTTGVLKVIGTDQGYIALKTTGWVYCSYIGNNTNTLATAPASLGILNSAPIRAFSASNAAVILYTTGASSGIGWSDNFSSTNAVSIPGGQAISGLPSNVAYAHIENHTTWVTYDLKFYTAGNNAGFQTGFNTGARNNTQLLTLGFKMAPLSRVPAWNTAAAITQVAVGSAIATQFDATDARAYRVVTGSLPAGLVMSQDGALTGTITASAGAFAFTVRAFGMTSNSIADRAFTWTITTQALDTTFEAFKTAGTIAKVSNKYDLGSYSFLPTDGSYDFVVADRVSTTTPGGAFAFSLLTGGTGTASFNTYGAKSASVASADTLLLLQGEGGSIVDTSTFARTVTNTGGVSLSTAQSRFGAQSLLFNGTANGNLTLASNASFAFGTGDFTVEAWVYRTSSAQGCVFTCGGDVGTGGTLEVFFSTELLYCRIGSGGDLTATWSDTALNNRWTHIAVVRASGVVTIYINGVASASVTRTTSVTKNTPVIGRRDGPSDLFYAGYIDELRISPSAAYTSNFAVASSPFVFSDPTSVTANTDYYARLRVDGALMTYSLYSSFTPATWTFGTPIMTQTMPINATDVSMESLVVTTSSVGTLQNVWSANTPVIVAGTKVRTVSGTDNGTHILTSDGSVYAAGYNADGRLNGTAGSANNTFFKVSGLSNIVRLMTYGVSSMCMAQDVSGIWYMFGNTYMRGDGLTTSVTMTPTVWTYVKDVVDIVSCSSGRFAKTKSGLWYCWGNNGTGVLGFGNTTAVNSPTLFTAVTNIKDLTCSNNAALILTNDGVLYGTGNFGDGVGNRTTAVQFLTGVSRVFAGIHSYIALKNDGTWWGGGENTYGTLFLGNSTVVPAQTPVTIPYLNGLKVRALEMCAPGCALVTTSDGNVFAVGDGNVFRSTAGITTTPVQLANVAGDVAFSRSGPQSHCATCTVKFDGKLWTSGATSTDYYQTGFAGGHPRNPTYLSGFTMAPISRMPTWNTASTLTALATGAAVSVRLDASDARLYKIISGALPTGLSMSADGLLTGTPTVAAASSFAVRAFGMTSGAYSDRTFALSTISGWPNAAAIRAANPSAVDGDYLILPAGQTVPIMCYVNFTNATAGKGWVLVQRGRESLDYWQSNGQSTASGLTAAQLGTNTPVANAPSAFVHGLTGGWANTRMLLNRPLTGDSFIYRGTSSATFNWVLLGGVVDDGGVSSVNANVNRYTALWGAGSSQYSVTNVNTWRDFSPANDITRSFCWTYSSHGGYQGWSHGNNAVPSGSFQFSNETHAITRANVYVEC